MDPIIELTEPRALESDYLAEFQKTRRVPQNLFYTNEGAEAFYLYRQPDFAELGCAAECAFMASRGLWEAGDRLAFISLGCGNGQAEKSLLTALHDDGVPVSYFGVDSSRAMLELARANLADAEFTSRFVLADFAADHFVSRLRALTAGHDVRIYAMMGATFGNFDQEFIARVLQQLLEPGDYLYLDVVPRYCEDGADAALCDRLSRLPQNMEGFFDSLLRRLCIDRASGEVFGKQVAEERLDTIRYTFCFRAEEQIRFPYFEGAATLDAGECIELLTIRAYNPEALRAFLDSYGFETLDSFVPDAGQLSHLWQRLLFRRR